MDPTKFNQEYIISKYPIRPKGSKELVTYTDASVQTAYLHNAIAIESEVIIQSHSPIISLVD